MASKHTESLIKNSLTKKSSGPQIPTAAVLKPLPSNYHKPISNPSVRPKRGEYFASQWRGQRTPVPEPYRDTRTTLQGNSSSGYRHKASSAAQEQMGSDGILEGFYVMKKWDLPLE